MFSAPKVRSSIRLRQVILLRSDIRLATSDIHCVSFLANRISLKPQTLISLSRKRQYHSAFAEYHYIFLPDKSKFVFSFAVYFVELIKDIAKSKAIFGRAPDAILIKSTSANAILVQFRMRHL